MTATLLTLLTAGFPLVNSQAQTSVVPPYISYQGRVTAANGTLVGTGTPVNRKVTFRIWNHATDSVVATNLVYSEEQTATISEGEFSVLIGQGTAVATESAKGKPNVTLASDTVFGGATAAVRYLGVTVDDGTGSYNVEISPRQQIVTSAYAFRAKYAENLGTNGNNVITALDNGNVGIGNTNPSAKLDVGGAIRASGATSGGGYLFNSGDIDGGIFSPADGVITVHTNAAERLRIDASGNLGVGTTTAQTKLDVNGAISATAAGGYVFGAGDTDTGMFSAGDNLLTFKTGNVERLRIGSSGSIGLGTSAPNFPLHFGQVAGDKIALYGTSGAHYGFGIGNSTLQIHTDAAVSDILFGYGSSGTFTENVRMKGTGQMQIGTTVASDKLNVGGSIRATGTTVGYYLADSGNTLKGIFGVAGSATNYSTDAAVGDVVLRSESGKVLLQSSTGASAIAINASNQVGIGTGSPGAKLEVRDNSTTFSVMPGNLFGTVTASAVTLDTPGTGIIGIWDNLNVSGSITAAAARSSYAQGAYLEWNKNVGDGRTYFMNQRGNGVGGFIWGEAESNGTYSEKMRLDSNGRLGIGTNSPAAPLHVSGGAALGTFFLGAKVWPDQTGDDNNATFNASGTAWGGTTHSIVSDLRIRASALDVTNISNASDARIKRITGRSAGDTDLKTLMAIEVTDYTFIDQAINGRAPQKKVIAQQVEKIFPQATSRAAGVIPDVFKKAAIRDGWIALASDLKAGERVRLIGETESGVYEVLEAEPNRFRTAFKPQGENVFVYGREVPDFASVDYVAVSMLNVSATQQIKREKDAEVKALRDENAELRTRLTALEAKDRARDAKLAAIEKMLGSTSTVMARPAASAAANGQE